MPQLSKDDIVILIARVVCVLHVVLIVNFLLLFRGRGEGALELS